MADTIGAALVAARKAMSDPRKSGSNPAFKSRFVPRDEALDAIMPAALDAGLFVSQGIFDGNMVTTVTHGATTLRLGEYPVPADLASQPQKYLAACTYASRGSLMLAFALAGDEDDDGNTASESGSSPKVAQKPRGALTEAIAEVTELGKQAKFNGVADAFKAALGGGKSIDSLAESWLAKSPDERSALTALAAGTVEAVE